MTETKSLTPIKTIDDLRYYLTQAMALEHATIPPYITALYSLKPGTNLEAFHIIRAVAVEEMLHLTLVANIFNAVGGNIKGVLTAKDFIPVYPTYLPTGETDFQVGLNKFSPETIKTFINIERTEEEVDESKPLIVSEPGKSKVVKIQGDESKSFYSIGLFYAEIIRALYQLHKEMGSALFCGDPARQITPAYYYNGGGDIIPVTDLRSAIRALKVIQEQGEGARLGTIYDAERELGHYYRFQQLELGQYYVVDKDEPEQSDEPGSPSGASFTVAWDDVYPLIENAKLSDYPEGSEVYNAAREFQAAYSQFLADIEFAFDGNPDRLIPAVGGMFRLKEQASALIRNPIPGGNGLHAAPIFRLD
ncbi:ferritin-like protein [Oscillatoria sp. FACHB-1406]|uniref:ferritin-like domain-containing protein n=1 Tax=Oscillatoria sp. FACHB-1406 TaxID=2692846 RepID=UPI001689A04F|nr:ferritin-like protein [Oscillatoria sp. FACHB-1406]MBD2578378.1 ferritin-like protein [Oscillatoria sp. FACHB-1406]